VDRSADPGPSRLEALLRGEEAPRDEEERATLALAAALAASEPTLPERLDARIDALLRERPPAGRLARTVSPRRRGSRGRWTLLLAPAAAAVALAVALPLALRGGEAKALRSLQLTPADWYPSSELVPLPGMRVPTAQMFASPLPASGQFVLTGGFRLRLRAGPGPGFPQVRTLPDGASVRVACTRRGGTVVGPFGSTDLWDRLAGGGFGSDAFIYTGSRGPVAPPCRS